MSSECRRGVGVLCVPYIRGFGLVIGEMRRARVLFRVRWYVRRRVCKEGVYACGILEHLCVGSSGCM